MSRLLMKLVAVSLIGVAAGTAEGDLLWDNGEQDGFSGRAISPPAFPDIRVVDDFFVPAAGWQIEELHFRLAEDAGWSRGHLLDVFIRETDPDTGGPVSGEDADLIHLSTEFRVEKFNCYFGGCSFEYIVEDLGIGLEEGQYWLGIRNPEGGGSGTNYWMTSGGGRDGKGTSTGYFSLDRAETWREEGAGWQHAFEIGGTPLPEPGTLVLLAGMSLLVVGRRRRNRERAAPCSTIHRGQHSRRRNGPPLLGCALAGLLSLTTMTEPASADLLWDNGPIDFFGGRAISPPSFPDIRVADDFFVPLDGWRIEELHFGIFEDPGWSDGDGSLEVYIRETDPDTGGPVTGEDADLVRLSTEYRLEKLDCYFRGCNWEYIVEDLGIGLEEGQYWLGIRNPAGSGSGTNYWMTSAGGRDGKDTSTGHFSLDRGETWTDEGPRWQHAFEIGGTPLPEPGTLALLAGMSLLVVGRRRRNLGRTSPCSTTHRGRSSRRCNRPPLLGCALAGLLSLVVTTERASGDLLWDNGEINGFSGRAISPPAFPDIRVVDDFFVPAEGWLIAELHFQLAEDAGWSRGHLLDVFIRETDPNTGGPVSGEDADLIHLSTEFRVEKFNCYFGGCSFEYIVEDLGVGLEEGQYWLGIRNPEGGGSGTNYWMTSGGGRDGKGTSTGHFSLDRGETWTDEGPRWQHAFEISGTPLPEPGTLALLAGMSLLVVGRRRRNRGRAAPCSTTHRGRRSRRSDGSRLLGYALAGLVSMAMTAEHVSADLLWDNDINPNGFSGRAVSPPVFPDIRVVDDFFVPDVGWRVEEFRAFLVEDVGWTDGGVLEVYLRAHDPDLEGPVEGEDADLIDIEIEFDKTMVSCPGQRNCFIYEVAFGDDSFDLDPGHYWIGLRNPNGGGGGTNYWTTSTGGPDGSGTSTGFFSFNRGETWMNEGAGWQHAFEIGGTPLPEPSTLVLLAGMGLLVLGRRRSMRGGGPRLLGFALAGLLALPATTQRASADLLWDNDINWNLDTGRAISPPNFPDIRVMDDFFVPDAGWRVEEFRAFILEDRAWTDGGVLEVYLRAHDQDLDGPVEGEDADLLNIEIQYERTPFQHFRCGGFGPECVIYGVEFGDDSFDLDPGHYWIGLRNPNGGGSGTNYWATSTGGPDGSGTSTGFFSLDRGETWMDERPKLHKAFEIGGTSLPEPGSFALLAGMGLIVLGRRRSGRGGGPRLLGFTLVGLLAVCSATESVSADLLWDNEIIPDGFSGRAVSPPNFPDIRVVDDFLVPAAGWRVEGFRAFLLEDSGWVDGGVLEVFVRAHDPDRDGPVEG